MSAPSIIWLDRLHQLDSRLFPKTVYLLSELMAADFPIPSGFYISPQVFASYLSQTGLSNRISACLHGLDYLEPDDLKLRSKQISTLISKTKPSLDLITPLVKAFNRLSNTHPVAVKPFYSANSLYIFPPQTVFDIIHGDANFINLIKLYWQKNFSPASLLYHHQRHLNPLATSLTCLVLSQPPIISSGLLFTTDPNQTDKNQLLIKAVWGAPPHLDLHFLPDSYHIHKPSLTLTSQEIISQHQQFQYQLGRHQLIQTLVPQSQLHQPKLTTNQIVTLTKIGINLHHYLFFPHTVSWFLSGNRLFINHLAPINTPSKSTPAKLHLHGYLKSCLQGQPGFPGIASGPVRIITSQKDLSLIKTGEILITNLPLEPILLNRYPYIAMVNTMPASTSILVAYSHQRPRPLIVNCPSAIVKVKSGRIYTVNGSTGEIFQGGLPSLTIQKINKLIS